MKRTALVILLLLGGAAAAQAGSHSNQVYADCVDLSAVEVENASE
jgi:hypothetical protein